MLTTGTSTTAAIRVDGQVIEHAGRDQGVVALQDPGDVLDGLAGVEADLLAAGVDGMPAELRDGDLHRVAGSVRRLLEDQRCALARQWPVERVDRLLRKGEDLANLVRR